MSRIFGHVTQNGYIVPDVDVAIRHWVEKIGIGPFFVLPPITFDRYSYKGVASSPELRVAIANSGDLQIELIQQTNDSASAYAEYVRNHGSGLNHLSVWSDSYDEDTARILAHGLTPVADGAVAGGIKFAFYDGGMQGCLMEVLDAKPHLREIFKLVKNAAENWDGADPVRFL